MAERKLLELWEVSGRDSPNGKPAYHVRVEVGAFQHRELGIRDPGAAEDAAMYEAIEVMRKTVREFDAGQMAVAHDRPRPTARRRR